MSSADPSLPGARASLRATLQPGEVRFHQPGLRWGGHVCAALLHVRRLPPGLLPLRARGRHRQPQAHRPWPCVPHRAAVPCPASHVRRSFHATDVLVIPTRVVPRLADLKHDELTSLMASVQHVGRVIERVYAADGLTIACQVRHHSIHNHTYSLPPSPHNPKSQTVHAPLSLQSICNPALLTVQRLFLLTPPIHTIHRSDLT